MRRCGVCKNCLNPAGKQVCLQLKVKREEEAAARQEELARRWALRCAVQQGGGAHGA